MQIKEFAQQAGLSPKTIRYYEDIGLLPPPRRLENGYRKYDEADVDGARFIAGARGLDFSLAHIKEIITLRDHNEAPCRFVLDMIEEKAKSIGDCIAIMQRMEAELLELHRLGQSFPKDHIDGKNCVCHLVSKRTRSLPQMDTVD
ncbi:MAG: heavy metal-responsive transcriptional regulator [Candidatus Promineifilaceae bacterium]|nr:heavy metal-responsive transcriptional regulator [Candidatus Promineifilaceae bacterium]